MAEFCTNCFLKLYPTLTEKDIILTKETELCEGCGKIVSETVLEVKQKSLYKLKENTNTNSIQSQKGEIPMAWRDEEYFPNKECVNFISSGEQVQRLCDSGMFNRIIESYCRIVFDRLALTEKLKGFSFSELFDTISAEQAEILGAKLRWK